MNVIRYLIDLNNADLITKHAFLFKLLNDMQYLPRYVRCQIYIQTLIIKLF